MPLKLVVDSIDQVPEGQRELYADKPGEDGKFRLLVDGLEDTGGLKRALKSERDARERAEGALKQFEGFDPVEAKALKDRIEGDEELQLIKAGKKEELRARWTEKMRSDYDKKLADAANAVKAEQERSKKWSSRVLDNAVREAAGKVGLHEFGTRDALRYARELFELDDEGNAVQLREGSVVLGKDGKTPFGPAEWLESQRETAPHWFPASGTGTGSNGSDTKKTTGSNSGRKSMKRSVWDGLDYGEKHKYVSEGGLLVDG